jgi:arsenate reductase
MKDQILHNPRCSKSREALQLLRDRGVELPVVEYLQHPLKQAELRELCWLLDVPPLAIVRTGEALFKQLGLKPRNGYSDDQWLDVLAEHPQLMERPIVVYRGRAAVGRPPEQVLKLLPPV